MLGAEYLFPEEIALLLNVCEGNADLLRDYALASSHKACVPLLKALLFGCCMKRAQSALELIKIIMEKLLIAQSKPTYHFLCLLLREAERAGNYEVLDYLDAHRFSERFPSGEIEWLTGSPDK